MKKIVITFGLISGTIVASIMGIGAYLSHGCSESSSSEVLGYTSMILAFSLIFVAVKTFRDKFSGGFVSFGKAFLIGLYISLIASTMYVGCWAIEYKYVFPDFMDQYSAQSVKKIKASGASQETIDAKIKEMQGYKDMYKNPVFFTLMTYAEILPVGLLVSVICAFILKKREKENLVPGN